MTTTNNPIVRAIAGMVGRAAAAHRRRQTSITLGNLPDHIRKDIGYRARNPYQPRIIGSTWPY
jgi:hypothetical protein